MVKTLDVSTLFLTRSLDSTFGGMTNRKDWNDKAKERETRNQSRTFGTRN
jgi:hypothetical protein